MNLPSIEPRRIVTFFPAATELCFVLGAFDRVVGVSHECDFPPDALKRPRVTRARVDPHLPSAELDRAVKAIGERGESLYQVDVALLKELKPDLLVGQGACAVCSVGPKELKELAAQMRPRPDVVEFGARSYEEVLAETRRFGDILQRKDEAKVEIVKQWSLAKEIRRQTEKFERVRVAVIDWIDPLMFAGHWTQELVEMAGGEYTLVPKGQPSRWGSWDELEEYEPDVIVAAACGRTLERAADELAAEVRRRELFDLAPVEQGRLFVADGNKYFNRPGPRLVYSAAILARTLHWDTIPALPAAIESGVARLEIPRGAPPQERAA